MPSAPELLPVRMLNEFVYCPRLFYLEFVESRWADSEDTEAGRFAHRVVDRRRNALPEPELADDLQRATSVRIESERLGLVAVVDRIDGEGGAVVPVDFKKGRAAPGGEAWPSDRIQILAQAALLRDAGYAVERGLLYYSESKQQVFVDADVATDAEVKSLAADARVVAEAPRPPLPLVHSHKCPRCSLLGLCLPDETNALLERDLQPARPIVSPDPDHRPLYVSEYGAYVGVRGGRVRVTKEGVELANVRLIDVSQLCVFGNVQVSAQALAALWARGVPVLWLSYAGWLRGWAQGEMSKYVELRRRQVVTHSQGGFDIAREFIRGKILNSRTILRRNARVPVDREFDQLKRLAARAEAAESSPALLGVEGTAARIYFAAFTKMFSEQAQPMVAAFDVNGRKRRPAPDLVNTLLGYTYSLLVKDVVATCIGIGLDPYLGFFHRSRYGRPSLALDLMEEFRPLIADSVVIGLVNNREIRPTDFESRARAVWLTAEGRRTVMGAYERRMEVAIRHPVFKYQISYRRVLDVQARMLAAHIVGEFDRYTAMVTR